MQKLCAVIFTHFDPKCVVNAILILVMALGSRVADFGSDVNARGIQPRTGSVSNSVSVEMIRIDRSIASAVVDNVEIGSAQFLDPAGSLHL
jgi:hypothetical protein